VLRVLGAFLPLLAACTTVAPRTGPVVGHWGGPHIGMTATDVAASFDFDCAAGRIDAPLVTDASGQFTERGVYFPGHGGPERVDEIPRALPATYTGFAAGDRLTLSITLEDGQRIGPFELRRDAPAQIFRCL
jgi:hypothetical protein